MKIAIVGCGVVGQNMKKIFPDALMIDCKEGFPHVTPDWVDLAFICVPTPMLSDGSCDTSIVETAIRENRAGVFCVKSTIPPRTIDRLRVSTGENIVFSPEFFGGTQHANCVDYDFVIIGGLCSGSDIVAEAYKEKMPASFRIIKIDSDTACLVKYAENAFLATKVSFFCEFFRLAEKLGLDFDVFREALLNDPRIGRSHTFVYREHPFWKSHCLTKDVPGIVEAAGSFGVDMPLLEAVLAVNKKHMEEYNVLQG